ncbi:aconitase X [Microbacterium halotolerans]|uniref:aconitase X n=1 Tax=Microbacterium halotolerans TaxID=246613 RepID=UPI000E6ABF2F|nr:aconitase X catalytic domain-containing protein [Microbacterium halotolerans]
MKLTDEEKVMRDGGEGEATAAAMDLLIRYGDALGAEHLCRVRNVAGTMTQPSPIKHQLVKEGGWAKSFAVINLDTDEDVDIPRMKVPTCQLQSGFGPDSVGIATYPSENVELQTTGESFFGAHGVNILSTCTPYQVGNLPVRGEHVAWMESSAVVYANSVLGARTNCEGTASTGSASLTGRLPCWGNHKDENRYGDTLFQVDAPVESFQDWGLLGYYVGDVVQEGRPVLTGDGIGLPELADLKHFGAATATAGGVELFHIPGLTPEAPTIEAAFGGKSVPEAVHFGERERRWAYETLNSQGESDEVDFILLGCPHASLDQLQRIAAALDGKRLNADTEMWIMTPRALRTIADASGCTEVIERAGAHILTDSCPAMSKAAPDGTRVFASDSAKQVHYLPAILGIEGWFGTLEDCVDAAVTGRWRGELR